MMNDQFYNVNPSKNSKCGIRHQNIMLMSPHFIFRRPGQQYLIELFSLTRKQTIYQSFVFVRLQILHLLYYWKRDFRGL